VSRVDPRLALLQLIEPGVASLDQAFADHIDGLERCPLCGLRRYLTAEERTHPPLKYRRTIRRRPTPEATIEAIKYEVRTHGLAALNEPANRERLSRCDEAAIRTLDDWLTKFKKDKTGAAV
jgi:hypothetical protein